VAPPKPPVAEPASDVGTFAQVERDLIRRALENCDWNKVHAAAMLKISRKKLYAKISKYGLEQPGARSAEGEE
jgi:DNA-binding NtrC family response regulator